VTPAPSAFDLPAADLVDLFETGEVEIEGRMPRSSNATLLVTVTDGDRSHRGIYKPGRGERPLWDFPPDLFKREVAMYRLAEVLGWPVIPPTALVDGPLGPGSIQAFVDADFSHHYFSLHEDGLGHDDLVQVCAIDIVANNTDRKSGHCLWGRDHRVYGIDNGLSFHVEDKLRTVLWDYIDDPLPPEVASGLKQLVDGGPPRCLDGLLDPPEIGAMLNRARSLLGAGRFPDDDTGGHAWPWPLI
jgi:uncharacterized repeat protein (TIGR03843 family)